MIDLAEAQKRLGCLFKKPELLVQALTHKSYFHEHPDRGQGDNERLEFLGDAVLDLVIRGALLSQNPDRTEGDLSKMRARVVSEPALAEVARTIGLGPFLFLGTGEEKGGGRERPSLLSDALEAVIAAIYLDRGMRAAKSFILKAFANPLRDLSSNPFWDYKTALQEHCQGVLGILPTYHLLSELGPGHQKRFTIEVQIQGVSYGVGTGKNKKEAQQQAAEIALKKRISECQGKEGTGGVKPL